MKYLAALLFLLTPLTAFASTQMLLFGAGGTIAGTFGGSIMGTANSTNNSGIKEAVMPAAGTFSNLYAYAGNAPTVGTSWTITISKNGVSQATTCTIAAGTNTCTYNASTFSVAAGDIVAYGVTRSGTAPGTEFKAALTFTPTNANDTIILGGNTNNGSSGYTNFYWGQSTLNAGQTVTDILIPEAGTIDDFYASSSPITSGSYDLTFLQNQATSTIACNLPSTTSACSDLVHSVSVAQGDTINLNQSPNTPGLTLKAGVAVRYVPTTPGDFPLLATTAGVNDAVAGTTRFIGVESNVAPNAVEASTTMIVNAATTITSVSLKRTAGPGALKNVVYTLRVNGADSSLSCSLFGAATGAGISFKTCTGSVSLVAGDLIDWKIVLDAAGTVSTARISAIGTQAVAASGVSILVRYFDEIVRMAGVTARFY